MLQLKRIYDQPSPDDGYRILVDRLWPRGVSKEHAALDAWMKEIAPSPELRTWFGHDPKKFKEFTVKYCHELQHNAELAALQKVLNNHKNVTLLYGAKDPAVNHAVVLKDFLQEK